MSSVSSVYCLGHFLQFVRYIKNLLSLFNYCHYSNFKVFSGYTTRLLVQLSELLMLLQFLDLFTAFPSVPFNRYNLAGTKLTTNFTRSSKRFDGSRVKILLTSSFIYKKLKWSWRPLLSDFSYLGWYVTTKRTPLAYLFLLCLLSPNLTLFISLLINLWG